MRGAPLEPPDKTCQGGIIPADAGSTISQRPEESSDRDHPRGCGEHLKLMDLFVSGKGSSPRMRGAPFRIGERCGQTGIIPADAGSTF